MRRRPRAFAFVSAPIDTPTLSLFPILPLARSLYNNGIGAEGASALATILKETQITDLKCAAAQAFAFVSMPVDTRLLSRCPHQSLAVSGTTTSVSRAPPRSLLSSRRR